jgi:hypothetical protein
MTQAAPLSRAEQTAFEETSRYEDVRTFIDALRRQTANVRVEMFGRSEEGRDLPLLIVGDPPAEPFVRPSRSPLPVVFVMANIHAGEVEGKEAVLHLVRRLTLGDLQPLHRSAVWLFAPIYNADGNEKISLDNRSEQNGPIGGVGTRENAKGLDLNRDFMKLESSEARALVSLITRWDPDVIVDLHTTNGSYHGYHLTYAPPLSPNTDSRLTAFARTRLLPAVRDAMSTRGWRTFDYGNFSTVESIEQELERFTPAESGQKVWRTFDPRPRFGHSYAGLRNRISILSEAYSYLDFEQRVQVTEAFVEEIMRFVAGAADDIRSLTASVDAGWKSGAAPREQGIAFALHPSPIPVDILVADVGTKVNPRSGKPMMTMLERAVTPTRMTVFDGFTATTTRPVPREYLMRPSTTGLHQSVARLLHTHGIEVEELVTPQRVVVDRFVIERVDHATRAFQGHHEAAVTGRFERSAVEMPSGSIVVRTNQALGRLVFYLLEPASNDGLTTWNAFDEGLVTGSTHPVLKSASGQALKTRPVR